MYRGEFCISLIIRRWDKKISFFFFWGGGGGGGGGGGVGGGGGGGGVVVVGAVLWIFMRGNFSSYICLSLKKRFVCPLYLNADI